mmetsp:Transcript_6185/g.25769  ORF Transcript_6185/g.25769 Transcript_6185/m.25769 type:complete len:323 (+) Transcript_6185:640-1608(+)
MRKDTSRPSTMASRASVSASSRLSRLPGAASVHSSSAPVSLPNTRRRTPVKVPRDSPPSPGRRCPSRVRGVSAPRKPVASSPVTPAPKAGLAVSTAGRGGGARRRSTITSSSWSLWPAAAAVASSGPSSAEAMADAEAAVARGADLLSVTPMPPAAAAASPAATAAAAAFVSQVGSSSRNSMTRFFDLATSGAMAIASAMSGFCIRLYDTRPERRPLSLASENVVFAQASESRSLGRSTQAPQETTAQATRLHRVSPLTNLERTVKRRTASAATVRLNTWVCCSRWTSSRSVPLLAAAADVTSPKTPTSAATDAKIAGVDMA